MIDEEQFAEIRRLIQQERWIFQGNLFQPDQTYRIVLEKEGFPEKRFVTRKPY